MSGNEHIHEALQKRIAANKQRLAEAATRAGMPGASAKDVWLSEARIEPVEGEGE